MSKYYSTGSRKLFEDAVVESLNQVTLNEESQIPTSERNNTNLFNNDYDYNVVNSGFLNKNVNPFIINYKVWQGLGDAAAQTKDDDEEGRLAFNQYDFDGIYKRLEDDYEYAINLADANMNNPDLEENDRAWWTKRKDYLSKKYNADKRDAYMYQANEWLNQIDPVVEDIIKFGAEFVPSFAIFASDLVLGYGPRLVNHLSTNLIENAVTSTFFPAEYAEQKRLNELPQFQRKFELDIMPGEGEFKIPSLVGFDGSINDYIGKNWGQIHTSLRDQGLDMTEMTYRSRLMAGGGFRKGAETVRDLFGIGSKIRAFKFTSGKLLANNPDKLKKFEKIWNQTYKEQVKDLGKFKGTLQYLKGRRAKNNFDFASDTLQGQQLRRQFDISNTVLAWTFGLEAGIFDSKYSSIPLPTKGLPLFEYDVPVGLIAAPIVATAGSRAYTSTFGKVPAWHAEAQLNAIARGQVFGTRKGLTGLNPFQEKMSIQDASTKYLLRSQRVTPDQIRAIDRDINKFDMDNAILVNEKGGPIFDQARRMQLGPEDYLYNEWVSGRLTDKRRIDSTYKNPTDRQAIDAFNNKMDLLNLDVKTARANNEMFMLFDEMSERGSPLSQSVIEWTKTAIQTQDRVLSYFVDDAGAIRPRYKGIIQPSTVNNISTYFDQNLNLVQASDYRRLITEAGDLGPLGSRIDTILYNDLEIMSVMEEQALVNTNNVLVTILKSLGRDLNDLPKDDPLRVFLNGAQDAMKKQQEGFTEYKEQLNIAGARLKALNEGANSDLNLSSISSKLADASIEKPMSLSSYENTFRSLTSKTGGDMEGYKQSGIAARGIADSRYDEIFGEGGIISQAYDVVRKKETIVGEQAPKINFTQIGGSPMFREAVGPVTGNNYAIMGDPELSAGDTFLIGRMNREGTFVRDEQKFPNVFSSLDEAVAEVQAVENTQFRKTNKPEVVTEDRNLRETLDEFEIASGINLRKDGVITLQGATQEGINTKNQIIKALREAGIFRKNQGIEDPTYIPNSVTVDDLVLARSILKNKISNMGIEAKGEGLDNTLTVVSNVLNQLPGYQKANETYQAYADVWFNDFGSMLRAKQPGGKFELADFNIIEEFIRFGIKDPVSAATNAFMYFGPSYKQIVAEGFAYALDNNRFTPSEIRQLPVLLKNMYNYNVKVNSQGEVITNRIGKDIEKISGIGGQMKQLADDRETVRIELGLDTTTQGAKAQKAMEDSMNAQQQLDKVMFALTGGEERVVPFIKDFAGKSKEAMQVTANTIMEYSDLDISQIKEGLLTGLRETLMNDIVYGSEIAIVPGEKPKMEKIQKEGVFAGEIQKLASKADTKVDVGTQPISIKEGVKELFSGRDTPGSANISLGIPQKFGGSGILNTKGFVTFQDESIIKQLNNKELEWTDVVKGWTSTLDKSLLENATLIDFLTTGEGAVSYLADDVDILKQLSGVQKNILNENIKLGSAPVRRPVNIPRKWTSAQITGWLNTYMKRITSRSYALGYASFQAIKMRNARFQVRMLTDPAIKQSLESLFRGEPVGFIQPNMKNALRGALIYLLPTIDELYPEETDEEQLAILRQQRQEAIKDMLSEIGLGQKQQRIEKGDPVDIGRSEEIKTQMESLNLN